MVAIVAAHYLTNINGTPVVLAGVILTRHWERPGVTR